MFVSAEIKSEPGSPREGGRSSPRATSRTPGTPFILMPNLQPRGMLCSCGINFSSLSTLAAHQKYYCTNRPNAADTPEPVIGGTEPVVSPGPSEPAAPEAIINSTDSSSKKRLFACPQCSFTTDKANGLNRHMRIHVPPPGASGDKERVEERYCRNCDIQFSSMKTYHVHKQYYCQTRLGKSAVMAAATGEPESPTSGGKEEVLPSQPHMVALPTSPVLIVPYHVLQGASLVGSPLPPGLPPTACIVLPNGTVKPLSQLTELTSCGSESVSDPARQSAAPLLPFAAPGIGATTAAAAAAAGAPSINWLAAYGKRALGTDEDGPLDLTNKRLKVSPMEAECDEEVREGHSVSLSSLVASATSRPSSVRSKASSSKPALCSPRPESANSMRSGSSTTPSERIDTERRRSGTPEPSFRISIKPPDSISEADAVTLRKSADPATPRVTTAETSSEPSVTGSVASSTSTVALPSVVMSLANGASSSVLESWLTHGATPASTQLLLTKGAARCPDCGTVFSKQENYEIHRLHYCMKRLSSLKEERSSSVSPPETAAALVSPSRFQFHCSACGTKFTSLDTLHAHKAFYCTQKDAEDSVKLATSTSAVGTAAAVVSETSKRQAAPRPHPVLATGWKCPCCDVYSATSAAAQKHLETHNNVRAFKCSLCGYKGNTLRGMRTHIRMHFVDRKTPELPEESFISCIVANSDEEDNNRDDRTEKCPLCAFKSANPETMLKHFALAHPRSRSRVSTAPSMIEQRRRASSGSPLLTSGATVMATPAKVSEKCSYCSFYTDSPEIMMNHQLFRHPEQRGSPPAADNHTALSRLVIQGVERRRSSSDVREMTPQSTSPAAKESSRAEGERLEVKQNGEVSKIPAQESLQCHHCNITFKQLASYAAHTQFYCPGRSVGVARSVTPVQ